MSIESSILKFSGHQTFPLRYGWVYKAVQEVEKGISMSSKDTIEQQMVSMGVGKNMVQSIRYWIKTLNLIDIDKGNTKLTPLAKRLFVEDLAYDKYLDKIGSIWLLHWLAQSNYSELNSSRWFFNYFNGMSFIKEELSEEIERDLYQYNKSVALGTLKKDIDCLVQCYSSKSASKKQVHNEDSFTSPFTELGLISQYDNKSFHAELIERANLPVEIFAYAVIDFLQKSSNSLKNEKNGSTVSFEKLLKAEGSPGRVFRLNEKGLSQLLDALQVLSQDKIGWTDTQGLKQVRCQFSQPINDIDPALYLDSYYCGA